MGHKHSSENSDREVRRQVRAVACPRCGAIAFQKCIGVRVKQRSASHQERWTAFRDRSKETATA